MSQDPLLVLSLAKVADNDWKAAVVTEIDVIGANASGVTMCLSPPPLSMANTSGLSTTVGSGEDGTWARGETTATTAATLSVTMICSVPESPNFN